MIESRRVPRLMTFKARTPQDNEETQRKIQKCNRLSRELRNRIGTRRQLIQQESQLQAQINDLNRQIGRISSEAFNRQKTAMILNILGTAISRGRYHGLGRAVGDTLSTIGNIIGIESAKSQILRLAMSIETTGGKLQNAMSRRSQIDDSIEVINRRRKQLRCIGTSI